MVGPIGPDHSLHAAVVAQDDGRHGLCVVGKRVGKPRRRRRLVVLVRMVLSLLLLLLVDGEAWMLMLLLLLMRQGEPHVRRRSRPLRGL